MKISLVPPQGLPAIWDEVKPHLEKAAPTSGGRYDVADIVYDIQNGVQHLWIAFDDEDDDKVLAITTTRFLSYPRMTVLQGQFVGGEDLDKWMEPMLLRLEEFATEHKCEKFEFMGRPGWWPRFKTYGWQKPYIVYEKEMGDG
jgi:hypothetical protein